MRSVKAPSRRELAPTCVHPSRWIFRQFILLGLFLVKSLEVRFEADVPLLPRTDAITVLLGLEGSVGPLLSSRLSSHSYVTARRMSLANALGMPYCFADFMGGRCITITQMSLVSSTSFTEKLSQLAFTLLLEGRLIHLALPVHGVSARIALLVLALPLFTAFFAPNSACWSCSSCSLVSAPNSACCLALPAHVVFAPIALAGLALPVHVVSAPIALAGVLPPAV